MATHFEGTRQASRRRVIMVVIFAVMVTSYLALSYQTILSAADYGSVEKASSDVPQAQLFDLNQSLIMEMVNTSGAVLTQSAGEVPYYVVSTGQGNGTAVGLVYLTTDVAPDSTFGYTSKIAVLTYVDPEGVIRSLQVVSESESRGYLLTQSWLDTFMNHSVFEPLVIGQDFQGITRATYTSTGVASGVRDAGRIVVKDYVASQPPSSIIIGYYLYVDSGTGTTDPPSGLYRFDQGEPETVVAASNASMAFKLWIVDGRNEGSNSSVTVLMNQSHVVVAFFLPIEGPVQPLLPNYSLVIQATNGTTDPPPGSYEYQEGQLVSVSAVAQAGFRFDHWELDGTAISTNSTVQVGIDKDRALRAVFVSMQPYSSPPLISDALLRQLLDAGAVAAFLVVAVVVFRRRSAQGKNALMAGSVLFLGFFEARMVTVMDINLLAPQGAPPLFSHLVWYVLYGGVLLSSILVGRLYCGYLCPFGALTALLNSALPLARRMPKKIHSKLVYLKYLVLGFVVLGMAAGFSAVFGVEPFESIFLSWGDWWMIALAAAFVLLSVVYHRFFCRYVCPAGAALALVGRLRIYEIKRWDECRTCEICSDTCPEGAIVGGKVSPLECLGCRVCEANYLSRDLCPHYSKASAGSWAPPRAHKESLPESTGVHPPPAA